MSLRVLCGVLITIVIVIFLGWKGISMRRELPFQEVIPLDRGIAVINTGQWFLSSLQITTRSNGISKRLSYDDRGICLVNELYNDNEYTVEIRRTDFKGKLLYKKLNTRVVPRSKGVKYIVLVGASIGKSWEFSKLGNRVNLGDDILLGNRTVYEFDKGSVINRLCEIPVPVSSVIIKECSAFFPRDIGSSQKQIRGWVKILRSNGIIPVLATVVPVTKERDEKSPNKFDSILEFNDFIRNYALEEGILVLDLEKAISNSDKDRHLRDEYAQTDGSHLVKKAYDEALDRLVPPLIKNLSEK